MPNHALNTITFEDFQKLLKDRMGKYYLVRWAYFKEVIDIVHKANPGTALELGPGQHHTIIKGCDIWSGPKMMSGGSL